MKYKRISPSVYIAENQTGFEQALYEYFEATDNGDNNSYTKKEIRKSLVSFPTCYPCIFSINSQMFECSRIYIHSKQIGKKSNILSRILKYIK